MKLDTLVLVIVAIGAALYALALLVGALALTTVWVGIPLLLVLLIAAYIFGRVISDRVGNAEDDYYDRNVEK